MRVVVVEPGASLTQSLQSATARMSAVTILGPVPQVATALRSMREARVDLAVVDLDEPTATRDIERLRAAGIRVLGATTEERAQVVVAALTAGASGLVSPIGAPALLVDAFRRAVAGELVLEDEYLAELLDHVSQPSANRLEDRLEDRRFASLTARELQVLILFAGGSSTGDVAQTLGISPGTVQSHVKSVLMKLDVHSKVEAITFAWRLGAIEIPA